MRLQPIATACLLAGIALLLYAFRLSAAPITPQEAVFNSQAQSIRVTTPQLFFHVRDGQWLQPIAVYANAAMRAIGGDDVSGRVVSAGAGAINVGLVFLIAQVITERQWVGVIAAVTLMLTPAHWSFAQLGTAAIIPVPFLLLWLLNVLHFFKRDSLWTLSAAAAMLGAIAYAHPSGPLTAVCLWVLTLILARRRNRERLFASTLVFGAAWLPAAFWFARHPDTYADTFGRWFVFAAHLRNPLDGLLTFMNPNTLGSRASLYWGLWDPSWLFFKTGDAGAPLLIVSAPLILLGLYRCARYRSRPSAPLVIGAVLIVPLAGASFGVPHYLADAAGVLSLLALLAGLGADAIADLVALRRGPLEDDETAAAVEGWNSDQGMPRS